MSEQQQQSGNKGEINSSKTRGSTTGKRPATVTKKASPGRTRSGKRYGSAGSTKTTVTAKQDKGKMKGNGGGDEEPMESEPSSTASRSTATMSNSSQQLLFHSFSTNNEQGDEEGTNEESDADYETPTLLADGDYEEEDDDDNFENSDVEEDDDIDEDILVGAEDVALFRRGSGDSGGKKNRASILGRGDECQILTEQSVLKLMETIVEDTSSVIGLPPALCCTLLDENRWNKDVVMEKFYTVVAQPRELFGAYDPDEPDARWPRLEANCGICDDFTQCFSLNCGHYFCPPCWGLYLNQKIMGDGTTQILCPSTKCNIKVDSTSVDQLATDDCLSKMYKRLKIQGFVQSNRLLRFCPGGGCELLSRVPVIGCWPIACPCGLCYCSACADPWHAPISCDLLKLWIKQCNDDCETYNWINAFTKDCPKCKTAIEKNGGCNHMSCRAVNCRFQFCWVCLGDWKEHQNNYMCNKFTGELAELEKKQKDSREALTRYLHYFNRFQNHEKSQKFEDKLIERIDEMILAFQKIGVPYIEADCLMTAIRRLGDARNTLKYTYAFAFYLKQNNLSRIFEDNQSDLEVATEQLGELLETREIDEIVLEGFQPFRQKVMDKCGYVTSRREVLLRHCLEGAEKNEWLYNQTDLPVGTTNYGAAAFYQ